MHGYTGQPNIKLVNTVLSMKNYSDAWIHGSTKHKTSNVVDHVTSDQHKAALIQVCKSCSDHITNYSPIA